MVQHLLRHLDHFALRDTRPGLGYPVRSQPLSPQVHLHLIDVVCEHAKLVLNLRVVEGGAGHVIGSASDQAVSRVVQASLDHRCSGVIVRPDRRLARYLAVEPQMLNPQVDQGTTVQAAADQGPGLGGHGPQDQRHAQLAGGGSDQSRGVKSRNQHEDAVRSPVLSFQYHAARVFAVHRADTHQTRGRRRHRQLQLYAQCGQPLRGLGHHPFVDLEVRLVPSSRISGQCNHCNSWFHVIPPLSRLKKMDPKPESP